MKELVEVDSIILKTVEILSEKSLEDVLKEIVNDMFRDIFIFSGLEPPSFYPFGETVYCAFCHQKVDKDFYTLHIARHCPGVDVGNVHRLLDDLAVAKSSVPELEGQSHNGDDEDDILSIDEWNYICKVHEERVKAVLESYNRLKNFSEYASEMVFSIMSSQEWWESKYARYVIFTDFKPLK